MHQRTHTHTRAHTRTHTRTHTQIYLLTSNLARAVIAFCVCVRASVCFVNHSAVSCIGLCLFWGVIATLSPREPGLGEGRCVCGCVFQCLCFAHVRKNNLGAIEQQSLLNHYNATTTVTIEQRHNNSHYWTNGKTPVAIKPLQRHNNSHYWNTATTSQIQLLINNCNATTKVTIEPTPQQKSLLNHCATTTAVTNEPQQQSLLNHNDSHLTTTTVNI